MPHLADIKWPWYCVYRPQRVASVDRWEFGPEGLRQLLTGQRPWVETFCDWVFTNSCVLFIKWNFALLVLIQLWASTASYHFLLYHKSLSTTTVESDTLHVYKHTIYIHLYAHPTPTPQRMGYQTATSCNFPHEPTVCNTGTGFMLDTMTFLKYFKFGRAAATPSLAPKVGEGQYTYIL